MGLKVLIVILFSLSSLLTFSQGGFTVGLDLGKATSLNRIFYNKKSIEQRTHLISYYPKNYRDELTTRFPNILNLAAIVEYHPNAKNFLRFKYSRSINYIMLYTFESYFDLLFPSQSSGNEYIQRISYYSFSYNHQKRHKENCFAFGIGAHLAVYKKDPLGKEIYNNRQASYETMDYVKGNDSTVIISITEIIEGSGKTRPIPGINLNAEYSVQFKKAGRVSFYANAYINLANSNFFFSVTHKVSKYDGAAQQLITAYPDERHIYRFTNNPLQLGIIYYLPSFVLNKKVQLKE